MKHLLYRYTVNDESSDDEEAGVPPSAQDVNASFKRSVSLQDKSTESDEEDKNDYANMEELQLVRNNSVP